MGSTSPTESLITGIHHINLVVPEGSLEQADAFYGETLGLTPRAVPSLQVGTIRWFDIATSGQQVHIAFGKPGDFEGAGPVSSRHPCFKLAGGEQLLALRQRIWDHYQKGVAAGPGKVVGAPQACDEPGTVNSGAQGKEYPARFFARDFAGNRLEFTT